MPLCVFYCYRATIGFTRPTVKSESTGLQQTGGIGLGHSGEVGEHLHEVASVASAQHLLAEVATSGGIEGTALSKDVGNVHGQHLGPQVAVVAGSIAATPDVIEIAGAIAR